MNLLAVDTSTEACSLALSCDGQIHEEFEITPRQHQQKVFQMCVKALQKMSLDHADLDALVCGCGPGSFTGTRVAAMFVQGIAFVHSLPVVAVSSLQTLAQELLRAYPHSDKVLACLDARMGEVYYAYFTKGKDNIARMQNSEQVIACEKFVLDPTVSVAGGNGLKVLPELKPQLQVADEDRLPRARSMLELGHRELKAGRVCSAEQTLPIYLRHPVMKK